MAITKLTTSPAEAVPERPRASVRRPTEGDLEMAMLALHGIFIALDWIEGGHIEAVDESEIMNARAELILAGKRFSNAIAERF